LGFSLSRQSPGWLKAGLKIKASLVIQNAIPLLINAGRLAVVAEGEA
jgi:hypothetical protein